MTDTFIIRLAGVDIEIRSSFGDQRERMKDYILTQQSADASDTQPISPAFTVNITAADMEEMLRQERITYGATFNCSDSHLEFDAIHAAVAARMIDYDVLLMHGSALCMDEEAYIFTAVSGTGKSTHSRLWREQFGDRVIMIDDDKPMLICRKNEILVCGTPWNGKHHLGTNICRKLGAVVFLERAEENTIEPVSPASSFARIFQQTYRPKDPTRAARAIELCSRICSNVKFYKLGCNMKPEAALVSYHGMQQT